MRETIANNVFYDGLLLFFLIEYKILVKFHIKLYYIKNPH